ncbi:MAG: hypothetical protein ABL973_12870 [Micropepsaceae bacterium]
MRIFMIGILCLVAGAAFAASAGPGAFPRDADSLRTLDNQQLRIVRRAGALCWHSGEGGFGGQGIVGRACVINGTEGAIASLKDPVLKAYSDALPMHVRYDEFRPAFYWQRLVIHQ